MDVLLAKQEISKSLNRESTLSRFDICFICAELLNLTNYTKHILLTRLSFSDFPCIENKLS